MLLITAALQEELDTALRICEDKRSAPVGGIRLWVARFAGSEVHFLRTGVGPARSAERLRRALIHIKPSQILVTGYAGALDPALRVGELVVGLQAAIFGESPEELPLQDVELAGSWELVESRALVDLARKTRIPAHCGRLLTSPHIIGEAAQKKILHDRFKAVAIDMETAALARAGDESGIGVSCVRAVTDEADDEFLSPFSYDPSAGMMGRAVKAVAAGNWIKRCRDWRRRATLARSVLRKFLQAYLQDFTSRPS